MKLHQDASTSHLLMNEQRQQAYDQLIQTLLECPSGEKPEILAANTELLDADFVQVVVAAAEYFAQQGEENTAEWLRNLATQLTPKTTPITQEDIDTYWQFLIEILQTTAQSNGDAQVIYPLLAANTDKLNNIFTELLRRWATNTLAEAETDTATSIAAVIGNFSNLIQQFPLGSKASNMEIAITGYEIVLTVYTRSAFPVDWAMTQNNLGIAYGDRILGERAENIESAIAAYSAALEVRTRSAFPQNHAETLFNLGILYQDTEQFDLAYTTFASAIATVKSLWGEIVSGDEAKHKQAEEWNQLYRCMVQVCLELERDTEAIEYIEQSKTRNLVELLAKNQQLAQIAKAPVGGEANLPSIDSSIRFAEIQHLLDNNTAIIQWYIFNDCFRAFIITRHNDQPAIWHSNQQDLKNLRNWTGEYLKLYGTDKKQWRYELSNQLTQLAQKLHLNQIVSLVPSHCQKLILIPHLYLHLLPLHALPLSPSDSPTPEYLIDRFPEGVSYAPSCQLLRFAQLKTQQLDSSSKTPVNPSPSSLAGRVGVGLNLQLGHLFAIQNPTNNLEFTDIEVETIAADFQPHQVLRHSQATKAALAESSTNDNFQNAQWLHFSCHGYFNFNSPLKSGLQLADAKITANSASSRYVRVDNETSIDLNKCLTLEDIFLLNLHNCRLVCLSACETGLVSISNNSDEYIGLASGFIRAGAANIISSLWAVSDFHTCLLMIKFYEILKTNPYNVAIALNTAQQWLRQATQTQISEWIQNKTEIETEQNQKIINYLSNYNPEQQPFKRPEFWAGFCAISPVYSVS